MQSGNRIYYCRTQIREWCWMHWASWQNQTASTLTVNIRILNLYEICMNTERRRERDVSKKAELLKEKKVTFTQTHTHNLFYKVYLNIQYGYEYIRIYFCNQTEWLSKFRDNVIGWHSPAGQLAAANCKLARSRARSQIRWHWYH